MAYFNEDQIKELEQLFGLKKVSNSIAIKDGIVLRGQKVWWKAEDGPELVNSDNDWLNIKKFPHLYSHHRPEGKFTYTS